MTVFFLSTVPVSFTSTHPVYLLLIFLFDLSIGKWNFIMAQNLRHLKAKQLCSAYSSCHPYSHTLCLFSMNQYEEPLLHTCEFLSMKRKSLLTLPIDGSPDVFGHHHHNNGDTIFDSYEHDGK